MKRKAACELEDSTDKLETTKTPGTSGVRPGLDQLVRAACYIFRNFVIQLLNTVTIKK